MREGQSLWSGRDQQRSRRSRRVHRLNVILVLSAASCAAKALEARVDVRSVVDLSATDADVDVASVVVRPAADPLVEGDQAHQVPPPHALRMLPHHSGVYTAAPGREAAARWSS